MIAVIGTCQIGALYMVAPMTISALETWPSMRRLSSIVGLAIVVASLVASSFAIDLWHLILTQGVLYGIGGNLLYTPLMFYLDEWFIRRKGLAFGIVWAGGST
jgi:MFS family permease